jgi:TonB family protein
MFRRKSVIALIFTISILVSGCAGNEDEVMEIEAASFLKKVKPVYPVQALANKTEGYVWVRYTVTDEGLVVNPVVTESEPAGVFDDAALLAIYQFEYRPRTVNGQPTSITGMSYRFNFDIGKYQQDGLIN